MFTRLQKILEKFNKISNLTRLINNDDYWISQVYDSIWPFLEKSTKSYDSKRYLDVGSGCGFPGLAYAITHPNSEINLIDSSRKKILALEGIVKEMNLQNKINVINDRIENFAHTSHFRHSFDIVTARAVSSPSTVAEYLIPMLNKKGIGILYLGKHAVEDKQILQKALSKLNGSIKETKRNYLPANKGERNIIFIQSTESCSNIYPRGIGKPSKYPLGY